MQNSSDQSAIHVWRIAVKHKSGSLEEVVGRARRRNLAVSFTILILLVASFGLFAVAVQRTRQLASRQMEFVAGISHELRTPLSVIHSAGYNLASGRVDDPRKVQNYGTMIQNEVRRLSNQVEQVLSFAGIQSGRKTYDLRPTQVIEIVDGVLAEYRGIFDEAGWQVEESRDDQVPLVMADTKAMESAIKNLLQNALKYAPEGKWLRVGIHHAPNGKRNEVRIHVADRGPGIDSRDLAHIFDPFYRGRKVVASTIPGTGLGLSLVKRHLQAHHGRVTVKSSPGNGTEITLHLPALENSDGGHS